VLLVLEQRLRRGSLPKVRFRSQRGVTAAARIRRLERCVQRRLLRRDVEGNLLALMAFAVEQFRRLALLSLSVCLACHALDAASRRSGLRLEHVGHLLLARSSLGATIARRGWGYISWVTT
jgi:hypothetical protein